MGFKEYAKENLKAAGITLAITGLAYLACPKDKWDAMTHRLAEWIRSGETLQDSRRKTHMERWHRFGPDKGISSYEILNMQLEGRLTKHLYVNILPYLANQPETLEGFFDGLESITNIDFCVDPSIKNISTKNCLPKWDNELEYNLYVSMRVIFGDFNLHSEILDRKGGDCVDIWSTKKF